MFKCAPCENAMNIYNGGNRVGMVSEFFNHHRCSSRGMLKTPAANVTTEGSQSLMNTSFILITSLMKSIGRGNVSRTGSQIWRDSFSLNPVMARPGKKQRRKFVRITNGTRKNGMRRNSSLGRRTIREDVFYLQQYQFTSDTLDTLDTALHSKGFRCPG